MQPRALSLTSSGASVGRPTAVAGAIAIILGGAAIGYAVTRKAAVGMSDAQSLAMATAVTKLDSEITADRKELHGRASTLMELPLLRRAIGTDARTFVDLVNVNNDKGGELGQLNKNKDDEIIEIGGVNPETRKLELWLLRPEGSPRTSHDGAIGTYVELVGSQLLITEVV